MVYTFGGVYNDAGHMYCKKVIGMTRCTMPCVSTTPSAVGYDRTTCEECSE